MSTQHPGPSGSQSSTDPSAPKSNSKPPLASSVSLPSVLLFNPFPAWDSPQVDERCFIYCSQTSGNRARGNSPWCRTICFRRVFGHEVHDGSYDASNDVNGALKPHGPLPLPHEGQPQEAFDEGMVGDSERTQYWKEGRYIWVSKSRWAAQEKLDSMMNDLPKQTAWMRYKEALRQQEYEEAMDRLRQRVRQSNVGQDSAPEPAQEEVGQGDDQQQIPDDYQVQHAPPSSPANLRYAQDSAMYACSVFFHFTVSSRVTEYSRDSFLFRITPLPSLVHDALHQKLTFVLSPAHKLLMLFGRSFAEGAQTR